MSKILATLNLDLNTWDVESNIDDEADFTELFISVGSQTGLNLDLRSLQFKFELKRENALIQYGAYPLAGCKYISSDQAYLENAVLDAIPDVEYSLVFSSVFKDVTAVEQFNFIIPRPPQPFPGWYWNSESGRWVAAEVLP
jgi:hypothetical protein